MRAPLTKESSAVTSDNWKTTSKSAVSVFTTATYQRLLSIFETRTPGVCLHRDDFHTPYKMLPTLATNILRKKEKKKTTSQKEQRKTKVVRAHNTQKHKFQRTTWPQLYLLNLHSARTEVRNVF